MTTSSLMASAISTPPSLAPFTSRRLFLATFSSISVPHNPKVQFLKCIPYSGLTPFSSWDGLKQLCISKAHYSFQIGRSRKHKGKGVYASLFGVGAPEALVIGVVALLVFGPKGLAEVARNLGKTLREFQPTIRELQEVSKEFKTTLEREIGLDDIKGSGQDTINSSTTSKTVSPSSKTSSKDSRQEVDPNGFPLPNMDSSGEDDMEKLLRIAEAEKQAERDLEFRTASQVADNSSSSDRAYSTEEYLKITEEQLQAAAQQQNETSTPEQSSFNAQSQSQDGPYSRQELSNITEQQQQTETSSTQQSSSIGQSQSQESPEQAASVIPSSQKPESET